MMQKLIISAAIVGSRPTKEQNPAVPYTPQEIAAEALAAWRAGAAIAHIHVRDPLSGAPVSDLPLFEEVLTRIRAESDMLVNLTTSGLDITSGDITARRLQPVSLRPDICSLDIGSMNFADRPFVNPPEFGREAAAQMQAAGVKPEIELFEVGHIAQAQQLIADGLIDSPPWFQLCMGIRWGIPATADNLLFMRSKLPPDALWSVLGVGRHQLPMAALAIVLGGHVRVGFEDNLYLSKGVLAPSNAAFVDQIVQLAAALQREVATPQEARGMLGIKV